jgi:tetratricopeptide (TPR) repeat protein
MSGDDPVASVLVEELSKVGDTAPLNGILERHPELLQVPAVVRLTEIAREKLRVSAQESLSIAEAALAIAERIGEGAARARALRAKANALWFLNRNQPAVALYDEAVRLFEEHGDETEVGRTLSSSIQPLIRLGEYARAVAGAERAREIFGRSGDSLRLARLDLNVANIFHRQDRFAEALEMYERAYPQCVAQQDREGIAAALHNMAVCLTALNDLTRAQAVYRTAIAACEEYGMPALAVQANYNIAYLHYLRGDYSRALQMLRTARCAAETAGDEYHRALCSMDRSEIYLELCMNQEAAEAAGEACRGFEALGMGYENGRSLTNLAVAEGRLGMTAESLRLFGEAKERFVREGNPVWPSLLDLYRALLLSDAGRLEEAGTLCADALAFFAGREMAAKAALCELVASRIRLRTGDRDGARLHCTSALARLAAIEAPHLNFQAHFLMGEIEEADGEFALAIHRYQAARAAAESLRSILRGEELKIAFMKDKLAVYEGLVRLFLEHGPAGERAEQAFACMEQAKSRALQDLLIGGPAPAGVEASGNSTRAREIRELREELNWFYHRIEQDEASQEATSVPQIMRLRGDVQVREKKLMALLRDLPAAAADQGMPGAPALDLDAIRAALRPDTVLVEYFRSGDQMLAAVLSRESLEVAPLGRMSRVQELARLLHFQFSRFGAGADSVARRPKLFLQSAQAHLRSLYEELVAPIGRRLECAHLVLVPHESLHQLPLHALFDGERYLIDRFTVSYAPSASVYALCGAAGPHTGNGASLILGVPDPQAPLIEQEIRALAEFLPNAELFVGVEARRQLLEERGRQTRLLHIATHGRFRQDNPMFSAIRLGDGYLTLYDLYGMRLPVELAALSGCSTGLSAVASGDELMGLVRGLLHAGAQSLLLTMWDVHDRTTAAFMKAFYKRYAASPAPAAALQQAAREVREERPHPYYWAPYVLIGRA